MQPNLELVISQFYAAGLEAGPLLCWLDAFSPGRVAAAAETRQSTLGLLCDSSSSSHGVEGFRGLGV